MSVRRARQRHSDADSGESPTLSEPRAPAAAVALATRTVPLGSVVVHPANPRRDLGELSELEDSIREVGVLQPPVVLPAPRVAAAWPQHAAALAGAAWVVLMGARRRTAAGNVAGDDPQAELTVLVREDAIADDALEQLDVMTAENVARLPLTPAEEARAFDEQVRAGRSQREIARRVGCAQSHVSKRLKLLRLPPRLLRQLEAGKLDVGDAMAYADADDPGQALEAHRLRREKSWLTASDAIRRVREEAERRAKIDAALARLKRAGIEVIEDPPKRFGSGWWDRQLRGARAVAAAQKAGTIVAEVCQRTGDVTYYSTVASKRPPRTPEEDARRAEQRAERLAQQARDDACARMVTDAPAVPAGGVVDLLVDAVITAVHGDAAKLAARWLASAAVMDTASRSPYQLATELRGKPSRIRATAAFALALAQREVEARAYRYWDDTKAAYLQLLVQRGGYELTDWDRAGLAKARARAHHRPQYTLTWDDEHGWCVVGGPAAVPDSAGPDIAQDDVEAAQRWAAEVLSAVGHPVAGWQEHQRPDGQRDYVATLATAGSDDAHPDDPAAATPELLLL